MTARSGEASLQVIGAMGIATASVIHFLGDPVPFFNVPVQTLGMAAFGSLLGFAYTKESVPRLKLYGYGVGGIFIGVWAVAILPVWLGWEWYNKVLMEGALAGAIALLSRHIVPVVIDGLGAIFARVINKRNNNGGEP